MRGRDVDTPGKRGSRVVQDDSMASGAVDGNGSLEGVLHSLQPVSGGAERGVVCAGANCASAEGSPVDSISSAGIDFVTNPENPTSISKVLFRDLGDQLAACVEDMKHCRSWPKVTSINLDDTSRFKEVINTCGRSVSPVQWLSLADWALNDLADNPEAEQKDSSVGELVVQMERFGLWDEEITPVTFSNLFSSRNVDYHGEVVRVAQQVVWEAVENSLPEEVGRLPLEQFCKLGTLHYVNNFKEYLVPDPDQTQVRPPKVMVSPEEWSL